MKNNLLHVWIIPICIAVGIVTVLDVLSNDTTLKVIIGLPLWMVAPGYSISAQGRDV